MRALTGVVLVVAAGTAFANPRAAAVHDRQGKAYFEAKQYDAAIAEFEKSYELVKKPLTLFKIASAHYAKADFAKAIDYYGRYLQADPDGPYAAQALEFTTIAKKALDDERAKREAAEAEARKAAEAKRAAEEAEQRKVAAAAHVKNAEAFVQAGAWVSAGDEYRAAAKADGDPAHLLAAAEAYRKQPDHAKARDAYRAYLDQVPLGGQSDAVRAKLAESVRVLEEEEKKRVALASSPERRDTEPKKRPPITRGWSSYGPRAAFGLTQATQNPFQMNTGQGLVSGMSFDAGAFARYQLTKRFAVRPEATIIFRSFAFDTQAAPMEAVVEEGVAIQRAGLALSAPVYFALSESETSVRIGASPFLAVMPYFKADVSGASNVGDLGGGVVIDYGVQASAEIDFGLVSLEVRFSNAFGKQGEQVDASPITLVAGLAFGIEPAR